MRTTTRVHDGLGDMLGVLGGADANAAPEATVPRSVVSHQSAGESFTTRAGEQCERTLPS